MKREHDSAFADDDLTALKEILYSRGEINCLFGWEGRAFVSKVARREGWRFVEKRNGERFYFVGDVMKFAKERQRWALSHAMSQAYGMRFRRGLLRVGEYDMICPNCNSFAIQLPPARSYDDVVEYMQQKEAKRRPWACIKGHSLSKKLKLENGIRFPSLPWGKEAELESQATKFAKWQKHERTNNDKVPSDKKKEVDAQ
jgi:hypothetical protein